MNAIKYALPLAIIHILSWPLAAQEAELKEGTKSFLVSQSVSIYKVLHGKLPEELPANKKQIGELIIHNASVLGGGGGEKRATESVDTSEGEELAAEIMEQVGILWGKSVLNVPKESLWIKPKKAVEGEK